MRNRSKTWLCLGCRSLKHYVKPLVIQQEKNPRHDQATLLILWRLLSCLGFSYKYFAESLESLIVFGLSLTQKLLKPLVIQQNKKTTRQSGNTGNSLVASVSLRFYIQVQCGTARKYIVFGLSPNWKLCKTMGYTAKKKTQHNQATLFILWWLLSCFGFS